MLHTLSLEDTQFKQLISALSGDEKRLSIIVDNVNAETMARARADNELRAELAALNLEVTAVRRALTQLVEALDAEAGE
jgi:hypothetical protein